MTKKSAPEAETRGEQTQIKDVFGLLERQGQRTISIEEMNESVAEQAAENYERIKKG